MSSIETRNAIVSFCKIFLLLKTASFLSGFLSIPITGIKLKSWISLKEETREKHYYRNKKNKQKEEIISPSI